MFEGDVEIFALSGGKIRSGAQVFRDADRAVKALIRHYRRHADGDDWSVAFVKLSPGATEPVSLTQTVKTTFAEECVKITSMRSGSKELSEWESRMSRLLLDRLSGAGTGT
jgi:hypothetical protein